MIDKRVLLLANMFPNKNDYGGAFIKHEVDNIKKYVKQIEVLIPIPFYQYFKYHNFNYDNVFVHFIPYFYVPCKYIRKRLEQIAFDAISDYIKKQNLKFDIIHAHFLFPGGAIGALIKKEFEKPLVITVHGSPFRAFLGKDLPFMNKFYSRFNLNSFEFALSTADLILSGHPELYDLLQNTKYKSKSRLVVKPISEESLKFDPIERDALLKEFDLYNKKIVSFVANCAHEKNPFLFIDAAKLFEEQHTRNDVVFIMLCNGYLKPEIDKLIAKNNLKNFYILPKRYSNKSTLIYSISYLFCALGQVENVWSSVVQEAMYFGVPIIATDVGQTKKYLPHKKLSYIVDQNPKTLVHAIDYFIDHNLEYKLISKNIRAISNNWFGASAANSIIDCYKYVIKEQSL